MGFADRMMRTEHGTLHEAEMAFSRVDVRGHHGRTHLGNG
jgi:hypothetical protein